MTVKELFQQLCESLQQSDVYFGHGVASAEDEVLLLLMKVMGMDFEALNHNGLLTVNDDLVQSAKMLLSQRISSKKPMAYVLGFSVFAGLEFKVDERALVPRSPFVQLIDSAFQPWLDIYKVKNVLDLCTGSGCIGLAVAHYFDHCQVDLSDLSVSALSLAKENQLKLRLQHRTELLQSDLFEDIDKKYDLIVTNPPYVDESEYQELPEEFTHEPKMALVSQMNGLEIPVLILAQAANYMSEQGCLFLEVGFYDQALTDALPEVEFVWIDFSDYENDNFLGDGQGICVFNRSDLIKFKPQFEQFLESHVSQ